VALVAEPFLASLPSSVSLDPQTSIKAASIPIPVCQNLVIACSLPGYDVFFYN
jgi:hypothetical protein